jgi:toxin FitB
MNVVDSSGWLDYFADGPNAAYFAPAVENTAALVVPVISLYEVFKRVHQQMGEARALEAVAIMMQGMVVDLDATLALNAARISLEWRLPMTDSLILATAQAHDATLWTQDNDFKDVPEVRYRPKA